MAVLLPKDAQQMSASVPKSAPADAMAMGLSAVVLCLMAMLATFVSAARAARVHAVVALRAE